MTGAIASNEVVWHFEGFWGFIQRGYMCEGLGVGVWRFRIWGLRVLDLAKVTRDCIRLGGGDLWFKRTLNPKS